MTGVVLAGAALIWVATRPSLSPQATVGARHTSPAAGEANRNSSLPWENDEVVEADKPRSVPRETRRPEDILQQIQSISPPPAAPSPAPAKPDPALAAGQGTPSTVKANPNPPLPPGDLTIYETSEPIKTTRFHIVRKGESLSSVAAQYYGVSSQWRKILTANQKAIKDPNKIAPGTKLIIPD